MNKLLVRLFCVLGILLFFSAEVFALAWKNPNLKVCIVGNNKNNPMMKRAFKEWQTLSDNTVRFTFVQSPNQANIVVYFVQKLNGVNQKSGNKIGLTSYNYRGNTIVFAKIHISASGQGNTRTLNQDEVYSVMLHEIGHAIGLSHNSTPQSIMYYASGTNRISNEDIKNLKKEYDVNVK